MSLEIDCTRVNNKWQSVSQSEFGSQLVLGGASSKMATFSERQESVRFDKLPGESAQDEDQEDTEDQVAVVYCTPKDILDAFLSSSDCQLFLVASCGLIALNGFVAAYFSYHA